LATSVSSLFGSLASARQVVSAIRNRTHRWSAFGNASPFTLA
jgi:hypothetical protein